MKTNASTIYGPVSLPSALGGNKKITLEWSTEGVDSFYTFYNVYRSENNNTFTKINSEPFIFISTESNVTNMVSYIDSIPVNKKLYYYYIKGINAFGEEGQASAVVQAMGKKDRLDINFAVDSFANIMTNQLAIKWKISPLFDDNNYTLSQVKSFDIMFGPTYKANPTVIGSGYNSSTRQVALPFAGSGYYYVRMTDSSDYTYLTLPKFIQTPDTIPPSAPTNLVAERNSDGKVTLKWNKNTETDLAGYKVYYANKTNGSFMEVTTDLIINNTFTEILDAENPNAAMHYKVAAVDKVYNISELSQEAIVGLPDNSGITAPVITSTFARPEGIRIGWQLQKGILKYDLQRKLKAESKWTTILHFKGDMSTYPPMPLVPNEPNQANYIDASQLELKYYDYRLYASDDKGNKIASRKVTVKPYDDGIRGSVSPFSAALIPQNQIYFDYQPAYFDDQSVAGTVVHLKPDGKVAKLLWNYSTIYPASLIEFKIYTKDDVPPGNTDADLVTTYTLVESVTKQIAVGTSTTIAAPTAYATYIERIQFRKNYPKKVKIVAYHNDGGFSMPVEITLYP